MGRLTHTELAEAHGRAQWAVLWEHAIPLVKMTVKRLVKNASVRGEDADDDLLQEGMLIAGKAMRSWDPLECAYSTHITNRVHGDLIDYQCKKPNGGIGGKDRSPVVLSTSDTREDARPTGDEDDGDDTGDDGTFEAHLTYNGVVKRGGQRDGGGVEPEGYGDPAEEADLSKAEDAVHIALTQLPAELQEILRAVSGIDGCPETAEAYAIRVGVSRRTAFNRLAEARRAFALILAKARS